MNKRFRGSYTIEASFVMAVILWALIISIQAAYRLHDETTGAMILHNAVERLSHSESEGAVEVRASINQSGGQPLLWEGYEIKLDIKESLLTGKRVQATAKGGTWSLDIDADVFDPENFLRLLSLLNQEE